jgi:hypothetical protein
MGLFDNIEASQEAIADKAGPPSHEVREFANSVQVNLTRGEGNPQPRSKRWQPSTTYPSKPFRKL